MRRATQLDTGYAVGALQFGVLWRWLCIVVAAAMAICSAGCFQGDAFTPAQQDIGVLVLDSQNRQPVAGAKVTARRQNHADGVVTPDEIETFKLQVWNNSSTGIADAEGQVVVPLQISGPAGFLGIGGGPGPDQVTHQPVAFRVEARKQVEYGACPSVHPGSEIVGAAFTLRIGEIGIPRKRAE